MTAILEKVLGVNWRTTAGAIAAIGVVLVELSKLIDGDVQTVASWEMISANAAIAFSLINARDKQVTSEKSGAK